MYMKIIKHIAAIAKIIMKNIVITIAYENNLKKRKNIIEELACFFI